MGHGITEPGGGGVGEEGPSFHHKERREGG